MKNRFAVFFVLLFSIVCASAAQAGKPAKKAIYVLPGYMGSKLYEGDSEVWLVKESLLSDIEKWMAPFVGASAFALKPDGSGSKLRARPGVDLYGVKEDREAAVYELLVENLRQEFEPEYDIVFYPYNWFIGVNESATELARDIDGKKYEKVVFVTHCSGGLLPPAYIAANRGNISKVERVILLGAPLFGTYSTFMPVEFGTTSYMDDRLEWLGVPNEPVTVLGSTYMTYDIVHNWIRAVTKNSPMMYQMFPSGEYLAFMPQLRTGADSRPIAAPNEYYAALNSDKNMNPNLTDGNARSHRHLRGVTFASDITGILKNVDTTLIGSDHGFWTPAGVIVETAADGSARTVEVTASLDGDGTVLGASAAARSPFGESPEPALKYVNFPGLSHMDLVYDPRTIDYVCSVINGLGKGPQTVGEYTPIPPAHENYIKLLVSADKRVDFRILNSGDDSVAASSINGVPAGFDGVRFYRLSFASEAGTTREAIYMPNSGHNVVFSRGNAEGARINFAVDVHTFDVSAFSSARAVYAAASPTGVGGEEILTLNAVSVSPKNIGELSSGLVEKAVFRNDWEVEPSKTLEAAGDRAVIAITGADAGDVRNIAWTSADPNVVTVSGTGEVTARGAGQAAVFASATDGSRKVSRSIVTVNSSDDDRASGGGCSAGFGFLPLALAAAAILRPRPNQARRELGKR
jgi:hypothetical protein